MSALALPRLCAEIPAVVHIPAWNRMAAPLAIALLEANVITDKILAPPNNPLRNVFAEPDECELAAAGLSAWWDALRATHPTTMFQWDLHVEDMKHSPNAPSPDGRLVAWFCLRRADGDLPRFTLARRILDLEMIHVGFGQTVLAVLYDALQLMPSVLTPLEAYRWAEWLHWNDSRDDAELLEQYREENGIATIEEVKENHDLFTREQFFEGMPDWVPLPKRTVSRADLVAAANCNFSRGVIAACDRILEVVSAPKFSLKRFDAGPHKAGLDAVDGCVLLLWRPYDSVGQVIDEAINYFWEGDGSEMIDAQPVPMTASNIKKYQLRMKQMLELAGATERLIELVGDKI